jgi:hypothetical protein
MFEPTPEPKDADILETPASATAFDPATKHAWDVPARSKALGPLTRADGRVVVGRVGAPPGKEATSANFTFWVPRDAIIEATQLVTAEGAIAGQTVTHYAVVEEVHRCSRRRDIGQESDEHGGDLAEEPEFAAEGVTYATAAVLRTEPSLLTPPRERSAVLTAGPDEAAKAYGADRISAEKRLDIGLIKNGGTATAGPGSLDLAYLLGENGGHLNVGGAAGRATKSSFLLSVLYCLLAHAERIRRERPSDPRRLRVVPVVFNVKNYDLMHLDKPSNQYDPQKHRQEWADIGISEPGPFTGATFYAPQQPGTSGQPISTNRIGKIEAYSWSLQDVIEAGLLQYLFADEDNANDNFVALVLEIEDRLTQVSITADGEEKRTLRSDITVTFEEDGKEVNRPLNTFKALSEWLKQGAKEVTGDHHSATRSKLSRRLLRLLYEGRGVLRMNDLHGKPLKVVHGDTRSPMVVDLNGIAGQPALQRFVVATVLRQIVNARTGPKAQDGLRYVVLLDELNRFAPKTGRDAITRLFETVAGEMRSQGVILFGAQQQASLVSARVIENAAIKALGQTGALELSSDVWRTLSNAVRRRAEALEPNEKLVTGSGFRQPLHLIVPFPAWAMNGEEAVNGTSPEAGTADDLSDMGLI